MDVEAWKQAIRDRWAALGPQVRRRAPNALYGTLAASAVLPVVAAANQGDFTALVALTDVVGGVVGNLIANQVQAWKDRSDEDLAAELTGKAEADSEWRSALDTLVQRLDAAQAAHAALPADDRAWFRNTLNAELDKLGSRIRVQGDGNVVVVGDMTDSVVNTAPIEAREGSVVIIAKEVAGDFLRSLKPQRLSAADLQAATERYLTYIITRYRYLDFKGMGMSDRVPLRLPLEDMYVPLRARVQLPPGERAGWANDSARGSQDLRLAGRQLTDDEAAVIGDQLSERTPLLDLLHKFDGLIILGDPGAGKTTFLKYLALRLAQGQGGRLGLANRLPILVPLSAYANALARRDVSLDEFLSDYYRRQGISVPVDELLEATLAEGRALVMFDGLDEVASRSQRDRIVERVVALFSFERQRHNKFLLTSRIVGYREVRPTADRLGECTLIDFDDDDITAFVGKWSVAIERAALGTSEVSGREAAIERDELLVAMHRNPSIHALAANPLLLTILALMKRQGVALPDRRVELYDRYVETLLRNWNLARGLDRGDARELNVSETLKVLAPLALWMQETSPGRGLVRRQALARALAKIFTELNAQDPDAAADRFLDDVHDYASLLLERGSGTYGFIHLTFQEYLAAVAIAKRGQLDVGPVADILARHVEDAAWREVEVLTIAYLGVIQQRDEAASELVHRLLAISTESLGVAAATVGEAVADIWPNGVTVSCKESVVHALVDTVRNDQYVPVRTRVDAGDALARLGDPRFCVDSWSLPAEPLLGFVEIPSGNFLMGEGELKHTLDLPTFYVSRYPVTVGQFLAFVENTDFLPGDPNGLRAPLNHPVRWVSWHEAMQYCDWLTERLRASDRTPDPLACLLRGQVGRQPWRVTLLSEAEWEKAARGSDGRVYPWGQVADPNLANYARTDLLQTSPVGCFPGGASPYGIEDMVGNVYEWTRSLLGQYPYEWTDGREDRGGLGWRVRRGGSFDNVESVMCCASREWRYPNERDYDCGFRVVVSQVGA